ncbi:C40 family peptidase [Peptacetobacter sp.]|uniref:C40 family peptidase n=1 Tax=Peptacetobacter sp. TaxID=2991975 RepID=UPI002639437E|nr:NlpC/P60 family protein [Peptacetobacter sp.]
MTKIFRNKFFARLMAAVMISGAIIVTNADTQISAEEIGDIKAIEIGETRTSAKDGVKLENGKYYYYRNGVKEKGWKEKDGNRYYFLNDYSLATSMWRTIQGKTYYFNARGEMVKNSFRDVRGTLYKFGADGVVSPNKVGKILKCDFLNVRESASSDAKVIEKIYTDDYVEIKGSKNGWYNVTTESGKTGWVGASYVTIPEATNSKAEAAIKVAKSKLGKPYKWGATGPNSFDCSGLMYYAYKNGAKVTLPRTSRQQSNFGKKVSKSELKPGDLVFFGRGNSVSHVGMYLGNDQYIHAPQTGDVVKISKLSSRKMIVARRVV